MDYFRNLYDAAIPARRPGIRSEIEKFKSAVDALEKRAVRSGNGIDVRLPHGTAVLAPADSRLYSCGSDVNGSFMVLVGPRHVIHYRHCVPADGLFVMIGLGRGEQIGMVEYNSSRDAHILHMGVGRLGVFRHNAEYDGPLAEPLDPLALIRCGKIGLPVEAEILVRLGKQ